MRKIGLIAVVAIVFGILLSVESQAAEPQTGLSPTPLSSFSPVSPPSGIERSIPEETRPDYVPGELIVKFQPDTDPFSVSTLAANFGGNIKKKLLLPDCYVLSFSADSDMVQIAESVSQQPSVMMAERNGYVYALEWTPQLVSLAPESIPTTTPTATPSIFTPNDPGYSLQWHFPQIQMPQAWNVSNGNGVVIAVVDTGVAYEDYGGFLRAPDLANTNFVPGWDFVNNDSHPNDDRGHGTHVAGTIAQSTNNGIGVAGIAYAASIMPVKVLSGSGTGTNDDVVNGIIWAVNQGARVINLSLGSRVPNANVEYAVNYAYNRGVVVVAASGNDDSYVGYPAAYTNAIAVGATRYDQTRAHYSNYGPELDIVAPGGCIHVDQNDNGFGDGVYQQFFYPGDPIHFYYDFLEGTSMAAPHVSGVAALLLSHGYVTTPDQVRQALQSTAKDLGSPGWDQYYGYGLVQAYNALNYRLPSTPTPIPTATSTPINFTNWVYIPVAFFDSTIPDPPPPVPPAPTSTPTLTPIPTSTSTSTATSTVTSTPVPTNTPTATFTPTETSTSVPTTTATPRVDWTTVAPMLTPRSGLGLAATNVGKLYAIGGENDIEDPVLHTLSSVEAYDPISNTWTLKASMPTSRAWLAAVTGDNGKIYAIGGAQCQNCAALNTVEEYDPDTNQWATKASMPTARQGLTAVAANGKIYAIGGYNGSFLATVEEYDPSTNQWTTKTSMPTPREHLSAALAPNGLIYAIGCWTTNEAYDPVGNTWTTKASMPTSRWALGVVRGPNGRIYAIGGNGGSMLATVEEYNPENNTWATRSSMPTARQSVAVARSASGKIYAAGGERSALENLATVEVATIN